MVKFNFYFSALFIFCTLTCFSQNEANVWYFGYGAGVSFSSGSPVSITGGNTATVEGSAVQCDASGNLMFYTDGVTIWNSNNVQMTNGFGLAGGYSSSQSALIVQQPGSNNIHYVFTTAEAVGTAGLSYSVIDMSLSGGLGEVTSKNNLLHYPMGEKVTAVQHSNGTDFWILSHEMNSNEYYAYLFNASGVSSSPVVSNIGSVWTSEIGCMKASPDGSKVAASIQYMDNIELADFDNSTGTFSNAITWPSTYNWTYGVEFSPDSKILYFDKYGGGSVLYQVDLLAGTATDIINSTTMISVPNTSFCGALQLGPDGKIYLAQYGTSFIGAVNDPNVLGTGCNYMDNVVSLSGSVQLGLPNCLPTIFNQNPAPQSAANASDTTVCEKFCIDFIDSSQNEPTSWEWLFPGAIPSSSSDQNPTGICYDDAGTYDVTLITSNANGTDTLILTGYITVYATPAFPVITQNGMTLTSSVATSYEWQLNGIPIPGATNQSYTATETGYYTVLVTDEHGCQNSTTLYVEVTGIEEQIAGDAISIFPNPSHGNFIIEYNNELNGNHTRIDIYNTLGQSVYLFEENGQSSQGKTSVDLGEIASGIYFVTISSWNADESDKRFAVQKLIVNQ